jgi:DNA-binding NarL/FixJ family response regulator
MLVVSSAVGGFHASQALAAGADTFLGKPVAVEELVRAVGNAISKEAAPLPAPELTVPVAAKTPQPTV